MDNCDGYFGEFLSTTKDLGPNLSFRRVYSVVASKAHFKLLGTKLYIYL